MQPKKIWANLGVTNLERTTKFYTDLGFKPNGNSGELTSFLFGEKDFIVHFFIREKFQEALKGEATDPAKGNEIIFTIGAASKEEVDNWEKEVQQAGGTIVSRPEEFGAGYYGFVFSDPDGHKFNVFYMKGLF